MNRYDVILAAVAVTALFGCATTPNSQMAESQDDKAYVTGSRLPVRDNSTSADVKGAGSKRDIDAMMRPGGYVPPKGGPM
jgi:hypothetical protein